MTALRYSAADIERIRVGYRDMEPLDVIAAAVGRSVETVRQKAKRMGISNEGHQRRHSRARMQERHQVEGYTAELHAKAKTPEALAKRSATMKALWDRPGYREHAKLRRDRAWEKRRGFSVPPSLKVEYERLMRRKFTAQEAGRILGLLPA